MRYASAGSDIELRTPGTTAEFLEFLQKGFSLPLALAVESNQG